MDRFCACGKKLEEDESLTKDMVSKGLYPINTFMCNKCAHQMVYDVLNEEAKKYLDKRKEEK